MNSVDNTIK